MGLFSLRVRVFPRGPLLFQAKVLVKLALFDRSLRRESPEEIGVEVEVDEF